MKDFLEAPVFRPSVLKSKRDRKTRLFPMNSAPVVREGRLLSDNTMPERDWRKLDALACDRIPARNVCAREFREAVALRYLRQAG